MNTAAAISQVLISRIYRALDPGSRHILRLAAQHTIGYAVRVAGVALAIEQLEPHLVLTLPERALGVTLWPSVSLAPRQAADHSPPLANEPALRRVLQHAFRIAQAQPDQSAGAGTDRPISPSMLTVAIVADHLAPPIRARVLHAVFDAFDLTSPPEDQPVQRQQAAQDAGKVKKPGSDCLVSIELPTPLNKESQPCLTSLIAPPFAIRPAGSITPQQPLKETRLPAVSSPRINEQTTAAHDLPDSTPTYPLNWSTTMHVLKKKHFWSVIITIFGTLAFALFAIMGPTRFARLIGGGHASVREQVTQKLPDNLLVNEMQQGIADMRARESAFVTELVLHEEALTQTNSDITSLSASTQKQRGYLEQSEQAIAEGGSVAINGRSYDAVTVRRDGAQRLSRFKQDRAKLETLKVKRDRLQAAIAQGREHLDSFRVSREKAQHELDMLVMELEQGRMLAQVGGSVDSINSSHFVPDEAYGEAMQELRRRVASVKADLDADTTHDAVDYQGDAARMEDVLADIRKTLAR